MFGKHRAKPETVAELREVSFFEGFSDEELERVVDLADEVRVEEGDVVVDQGRVGLDCFVILEGRAGVWVGDEHVASLTKGSMIGEMALVEHTPRSASVVAETPMRLLRFDTKAFKRLLEEMPLARDRVMSLLAARLRANRRLKDVVVEVVEEVEPPQGDT
ncbi:MAG: hypothetical protein KatS3mg008_0856 [Acidimicrobiales bacterium]|nr:MAG: hypothetical protein KatS3mg008_0856 [Acidimicrobiales bacterium]